LFSRPRIIVILSEAKNLRYFLQREMEVPVLLEGEQWRSKSLAIAKNTVALSLANDI